MGFLKFILLLILLAELFYRFYLGPLFDSDIIELTIITVTAIFFGYLWAADTRRRDIPRY